MNTKIRTVCNSCGQRVTGDSIHTCSPQYRELSDEEIANIYEETIISMPADNPLLYFARAILKKASEK